MNSELAYVIIGNLLGPEGYGYKEDKGWRIIIDKNGHGHGKWKLKNRKGIRQAILSANGKILRN